MVDEFLVKYLQTWNGAHYQCRCDILSLVSTMRLRPFPGHYLVEMISLFSADCVTVLHVCLMPLCFVTTEFMYYTVSQNNDTDLAHYNFNTHQPILVIFGRDVAERVYYQMTICYPTSLN